MKLGEKYLLSNKMNNSMTRLTINIVFILLQQVAFAQTNVMEYDNLKTLNLKGKVKTISEISYHAALVNSEVVKLNKGWNYDWQHDELYFFDTLGNLLSRKEVINSIPVENYSIKLDSNNRIIEVNRLVKTTNYEYDSLNRILSSIEKEKIPESSENENLHNFYFPKNQNYYYNSNNLLVKKEELVLKKIFSTQTFEYDNFNNLIFRQINYSGMIESHKYEYDDNNLLIRYEWSDSKDGIAEITINEYLNQIKIKERWELYLDNELEGYIDTKFENGNIAETKEIEIDGTVSGKETMTYEYDENGNWIKMIMNSNDNYFIIERTIDYY